MKNLKWIPGKVHLIGRLKIYLKKKAQIDIQLSFLK
jgi:hypothetical protein